jgi:hypothetical protein
MEKKSGRLGFVIFILDPVGQNPMHTYRESIVLGVTSMSNAQVKQLSIQLSPGSFLPLRKEAKKKTAAVNRKYRAVYRDRRFCCVSISGLHIGFYYRSPSVRMVTAV